MNRRNFLKTILGGIAAVPLLKGITPATTVEKTEEVTDHVSRSIGYANMAHPSSGTIILLPDSSKLDIDYPHAPTVIRFSDKLLDKSYYGYKDGDTLQVVDKPVVNSLQTKDGQYGYNKIYMTTRKCPLRLSAEYVQDYILEQGNVELVLEIAMKTMRVNHYRYFHSITLVPVINPETFETIYGILLRGA